jgi:hypothetical protein
VIPEVEFGTSRSTVDLRTVRPLNGTTLVAEQTTYAVELVAPYQYAGLRVSVDGDELVVGNGSLEERMGLRNLTVRERQGDIVRIAAEDGRELMIRSLDIHPLDLVEFILDARAASRGLNVPQRPVLRPWPDASAMDQDPEAMAGDMEPADAGSAPARSLRTRRKLLRSIVGLTLLAATALTLGGVVGDVVNDASGPGVGEAVEIRGPFVVRDVTGVGADVLSPFSAEGPWELEWENLSAGADPITIVAISNVNREERTLVDADSATAGSVGPLPSGSYRLSIESDSSWHIVVSVAR